MGQVDAAFDRAVNAHREAVAHARKADQELERLAGDDTGAGVSSSEQAGLVAELRAAADGLLPGWLGVPLDGSVQAPKLGGSASP
ncbi:MAG: hypothetical protein ACRDT4_23760, partial [Micromonosporaceae bacterium]